MSEISAVLLIPHGGDLHGLLKEGVCGSRPPVAHNKGSGPPVAHNKGSGWGAGAHPWSIPHALVLAWDGKVVPEGCDRLARARNYEDFWQPDDLDELHWLTVDAALGTVVLLDAEGQEVTDVE